MPELRVGAGWSDRRWKEGFQKLTAAQKLVIENSLRGLLTALRDCRDPLLDSALQGGAIYLVARTAIHDHRALNELVAGFAPPRDPV